MKIATVLRDQIDTNPPKFRNINSSMSFGTFNDHSILARHFYKTAGRFPYLPPTAFIVATNNGKQFFRWGKIKLKEFLSVVFHRSSPTNIDAIASPSCFDLQASQKYRFILTALRTIASIFTSARPRETSALQASWRRHGKLVGWNIKRFSHLPIWLW